MLRPGRVIAVGRACLQFSAIVYGAGNRFIDSVTFIRDIYAELREAHGSCILEILMQMD